MDRRLTRSLEDERQARELSSATPGLGELQALRIIQARRLIEGKRR